MPFICPTCERFYMDVGSCPYCVKENHVTEEERNEERYHQALDKEALDKAYKETES